MPLLRSVNAVLGLRKPSGVALPIVNLFACIEEAAIMMSDISDTFLHTVFVLRGICLVITGRQMRAARALLGLDQKALAELSGLSVPTIQRMEASSGHVRGVIDSLTKVVAALELAGVELIGEGAPSATGGRGVRLKHPPPKH